MWKFTKKNPLPANDLARIAKFFKQTFSKIVAGKYEYRESVLFLPLLFFIAGIRTSKFALGMGISVIFIIFLLLLWSAIDVFRGNINYYFNPLRNVMVPLALSMWCGMMYAKCRCESGTFPPKYWQRSVFLTLRADSMVIKNKRQGIFYGYGIIGDGPNAHQLKGERIFFAVECTNGVSIPFRGQKFKIYGKLKYVRENSSWWFFKHLKNMRVRWMISDGCLLSLESKASPWQVLFRKIFDGFLHTITIGVEDREIEHGIMSGMLTGHRQGIDKPSQALFRGLGISHLFAVSGIHMGILAATIDFFLKVMCVSKRFRAIPILILLTFYVNAIGCSPSSIRALSMVAFYYTSSLLGRRPIVLSALTNSALFHVLYDPFVVFNISFLLSYAVVAGIVLIGVPLKNFLSHIFLNLHGLKFESYPPIDRILFRLKKLLITSFSISLAACFVSLSISIDHFGGIPLLTIPANMIIVPLATMAIIIGAVTLFFGLWKVWALCRILNNISCRLIYIFRLLAHGIYNDSCYLRNITIHYVGGTSLTMLILAGAYIIFSIKNTANYPLE
ncbi:MAG: ComEC/Rec2 family competence protein [Puniceicoccales bacterium]|nr:ComEC/Rec2 family competence protein [Puniceicoccales bacterium]